MLDASNPDPAPKAKKIKSQHRPTQRFWPNSIAAGVLQQQGGAPGTNPDGKNWGWVYSSLGLVGGPPGQALQRHKGCDSGNSVTTVISIKGYAGLKEGDVFAYIFTSQKTTSQRRVGVHGHLSQWLLSRAPSSLPHPPEVV